MLRNNYRYFVAHANILYLADRTIISPIDFWSINDSIGESERIMSISIVITITTTMIIAMMIIIGNCETYGKDYERMPRLLDVFRHFRQSKESQENRGYIEQCRATNLRKDQLGHVNVFAFLDPSWNYSYRQAVM